MNSRCWRFRARGCYILPLRGVATGATSCRQAKDGFKPQASRMEVQTPAWPLMPYMCGPHSGICSLPLLGIQAMRGRKGWQTAGQALPCPSSWARVPPIAGRGVRDTDSQVKVHTGLLILLEGSFSRVFFSFFLFLVNLGLRMVELCLHTR